MRRYKRYVALERLVEILATEAAAAITHLDEEDRILDGWPTQTMGDGTPRGTNESTIVERHAQARQEIARRRQQIEADAGTITEHISRALDHCREAKGHRAPKAPEQPTTATFCTPVGREGADLPYEPYSRDPRNGWADSTCRDLAARGPLCEACSIRERRWRLANNLKPTNDFIPSRDDAA